MSAISKVSRRAFLKVTAGAGAGLVLGCMIPSNGSANGRSGRAGATFSPNVFLQIGTDGQVTITAPRPECGTGVRTSLVMLVAEELGVDWKSVKVRQAVADSGAYGDQGIGGSRSVASSYQRLRHAGATAALMLRQAAAQQWGVSVEQCRIDSGAVVGGSNGDRLTFGQLAEAASKLPVPDASAVRLKDRSEFKIIGKPTPRIDGAAIADGTGVFGLDVRVPGMLFACIARPVPFGGSASDFDDSDARKVPGVKDVFRFGSGVAVVADSSWAALKACDALKVTWDGGPNASLDTAELTRRFKERVATFPEMPSGSTKVVEATYELPFLAHAPMEPMNCTASVKADSCEVWVPTQVPDAARGNAARASGLSEDRVKVNLTLVGGGFGRRLGAEYVSEAVAISKRIGAPVQLIWTRDDETKHDHYRPMTYHAMKGAVDGAGMPLAYYHQCLVAGGGRRGGGGEGWSGQRTNYEFPNGGFLRAPIESPIPTGAWRSVDATFLCFVGESFLDELAHAGGKDPLQIRLQLMRNQRLKGTLEMAAEKAKWGSPLPKGWGRGVACFSGFGSFCTQIADVEVKPSGHVKVHKVVAVMDCGVVVNPLGVETQVQGATVDAVATLLYSEITIKGGGVEQRSLGDFGWARMKDTPVVEVHTVPSNANPSGVGEPGYPAAGPAIANAIFAATGKRLRSLPIGNPIGSSRA